MDDVLDRILEDVIGEPWTCRCGGHNAHGALSCFYCRRQRSFRDDRATELMRANFDKDNEGERFEMTP